LPLLVIAASNSVASFASHSCCRAGRSAVIS
jgi:hypothetical protein